MIYDTGWAGQETSGSQRLQGSRACLSHPLSTLLFNTGREVPESDHLNHASMEAFRDQQSKGKLAECTERQLLSTYSFCLTTSQSAREKLIVSKSPNLAWSAASPDPFHLARTSRLERRHFKDMVVDGMVSFSLGVRLGGLL